MISVIIPVYNAAAYLPACLDSVLAQSYSDIELLLVDDGSTDGSGELCNDYACRDARVTVLHQANAGPAAARNAALEVAQGEWVAFIDSDDVVHNRYLEVLHRHITADADLDVVQVAHQMLPMEQRQACSSQLDKALPDAIRQQSVTGQQALLAMLYQQGGISSAPWGKLFRRSLFADLRFPIAFRVYEDLYLMAQAYQRIRKMACLDVPLYFYFKQDSGTLNSQSIRRPDAFVALETLEAQFMVQGRPDVVRAMRERRLSIALNILRLLAKQPHTDANIAMAHRCWQHIKALRGESVRDSKARWKNRVVAALSYLISR